MSYTSKCKGSQWTLGKAVMTDRDFCETEQQKERKESEKNYKSDFATLPSPLAFTLSQLQISSIYFTHFLVNYHLHVPKLDGSSYLYYSLASRSRVCICSHISFVT